MQEDLSGLARELRKETCPRRVIDGAVRRIAAQPVPPRRLRYAIPVALAGSFLVCSLLVWWRLAGGNAGPQPEWVEQQAHRRMQVARQTETALGLLGAVLVQAGTHSENVISARALPPLRNGLETAKNKLIRNTEL